MEARSVIPRAVQAAKSGIAPALKTAGFLIAITVPLSLAVTILEWTGVLPIIADFIEPCMAFLGLPGEAAMVILSSILLNIYSAIAVIEALGLSGRAVTILALICLIAHNMVVETAIMKKTGSSVIKMVILRLFVAFAAGALLNLILPGRDEDHYVNPFIIARPDFWVMLKDWALYTLILVAKIFGIVLSLMILLKVLDEFGAIQGLSKILAPILTLVGLPPSTAFLWLVANTLGLAYGAAVIIDRVATKKNSPSEADLLNHSIGICHSLLEDTLLFASIGVGAFWITIPRIVLAAIVTWIERLRVMWRRGSFKVETL